MRLLFYSGGEGGAIGLFLRTTPTSGFAVIFLFFDSPRNSVKYTIMRISGIPTPSPTPRPITRVVVEEEVVEEEEVVVVVVVEAVSTDTDAVG